jgi:hypothetical protein
MASEWTERVATNRPTAPGHGASPRRRARIDVARRTGPLCHGPDRSISPTIRSDRPPWYAARLMAKAKRRKRLARRRKANHGRKPNAGRGS